MGRLIDADKFAEKFTGQYEFMKRVIDEQSTVDAVEVVRCKDCKYWHTEACVMDDWNFSDTTGSDYCSRGERKE